MVDTFANSSLCSKSSEWSREQDKAFETAIALYCEDEDQERWQKIADSVPGKNVMEVEQHFHVLMDDIKQIEAGIIPLPPYPHQQSDSSKARCKVDQERKKGIAWSEDEHMAFLRGLEQFGKGDWRSISRNCVITRTPTQVASHAQKYFMRQNSAGKEKKRNSIHDITSSKNKNSSKSSNISYSVSHDTMLTTPQEQFIKNSSYPHGFVPRNELEGYVPFMSQSVYISDVSSFGVRPMIIPSSVAANQAQNVSASQPNMVPLAKSLSGKP